VSSMWEIVDNMDIRAAVVDPVGLKANWSVKLRCAHGLSNAG